VLTVITIITMLMAILLPAVNMAIETARRLTCQKNLNTLGAATFAYVTHHPSGHLPTLGREFVSVDGPGKPRAPKPNEQGGPGSLLPLPIPRDTDGFDVFNNPPYGWTFQILPFMDTANLQNEPDARTQTARIPNFVCPSDKSNRGTCIEWEPFAGGPAAGGWGRPNITSYAASCGTCDSRVPYRLKGKGRSPKTRCTGALPDTSGGMRSYGPERVKDGQSSTILVYEKFIDAQLAGLPHCGDAFGILSGKMAGVIPDAVRSGQLPPREIRPTGSPLSTDPFHCPQLLGAGSWHPKIFNVLFLDGSVRGLNYNVDLDVYHKMTMANDGRYAF
jgi:prepilin-type processing-associated H-X9-DG protein